MKNVIIILMLLLGGFQAQGQKDTTVLYVITSDCYEYITIPCPDPDPSGMTSCAVHHTKKIGPTHLQEIYRSLESALKGYELKTSWRSWRYKCHNVKLDSVVVIGRNPDLLLSNSPTIK